MTLALHTQTTLGSSFYCILLGLTVLLLCSHLDSCSLHSDYLGFFILTIIMAKSICHCSRCLSSKTRTARTIRNHLKSDEELLASNPFLDENFRSTLIHCIYQNTHAGRDSCKLLSYAIIVKPTEFIGDTMEMDISDSSSQNNNPITSQPGKSVYMIGNLFKIN